MLVTIDDTIAEYTLDGTFLGSVVVPVDPAPENVLRDLVDVDGDPYVYRGTATPSLTHDAPMGWVHDTFAEWNTINNVSYGGVALTTDWIWVTDMAVAGDESGLVRFSRGNDPTERVASGGDYIDVNTGLDRLRLRPHQRGHRRRDRRR